jgi:hypothetical protein
MDADYDSKQAFGAGTAATLFAEWEIIISERSGRWDAIEHLGVLATLFERTSELTIAGEVVLWR